LQAPDHADQQVVEDDGRPARALDRVGLAVPRLQPELPVGAARVAAHVGKEAGELGVKREDSARAHRDQRRQPLDRGVRYAQARRDERADLGGLGRLRRRPFYGFPQVAELLGLT
jgi:hypothetical protein